MATWLDLWTERILVVTVAFVSGLDPQVEHFFPEANSNPDFSPDQMAFGPFEVTLKRGSLPGPVLSFRAYPVQPLKSMRTEGHLVLADV